MKNSKYLVPLALGVASFLSMSATLKADESSSGGGYDSYYDDYYYYYDDSSAFSMNDYEMTVTLEPFVVIADGLPDFTDPFYYNNWLDDIDNNILGGFNNYGVTTGPSNGNNCGGTGSLAANHNFTAPVDPTKPVTTVQIVYETLGTVPGTGTPYTHAFVLVTAPGGTQFVVRAGPADGNGSPGSGGSYGTINAAGVQYAVDPGTGAINGDFADAFINGHLNASQTVLQTNASPDDVLAALQDYSNAVNAAQITYGPFTANSNSFAHEAVMSLGVGRAPDAASWAPASQTHLICP